MSPVPLSEVQRAVLLDNGRAAAAGVEYNPAPAALVFLPGTNTSWLLSEIDPEDETKAYGLFTVEKGLPRLGYIDLKKVAEQRGQLNLGPSVDRDFRPRYPIAHYAEIARMAGRIVTREW